MGEAGSFDCIGKVFFNEGRPWFKADNRLAGSEVSSDTHGLIELLKAFLNAEGAERTEHAVDLDDHLPRRIHCHGLPT